MQFLAFRLYGPLAAWGTTAVGELRPSRRVPSRSAVLGLVGACLGLRRDDADAQAALSASFGVAVRVDAGGSLLSDYHTVQAPHRKRGFTPRNRRAELAEAHKVETMITRRQYVQDGLATGVLWARENGRWGLDDAMGAMQYPVFTPYLGRKSCPLALPLQPRLGFTDSLQSMLEIVEGLFFDNEFLKNLHRDPRPLLVWDADLPGPCPAEGRYESTWRRDQPLDRSRWQFTEREERSMLMEAGA